MRTFGSSLRRRCWPSCITRASLAGNPLFNVILGLLSGPQGDADHVDWSLWIALFIAVLVEVPDQRADVKLGNLLAFDSLYQPLVNVKLLFPLSLVLHYCPAAGQLVVGDDDSVRGDLLQVDLPTDRSAIDNSEEALFSDMVFSLPAFHHYMKGRTQETPQHVADISGDLVVVLLPKSPDLGWPHDLCYRILCSALAVVFSGRQRHQRSWRVVLVSHLHQNSFNEPRR